MNRILSIGLGRLAQGNDQGVLATDTIDYIVNVEVPAGRDAIYVSFVCDNRSLKSESYIVWIVVGCEK